jgi:hypothetical protein
MNPWIAKAVLLAASNPAASRQRSPLGHPQLVELIQPIGHPVPTGAVLVHHLQVVDSERLKSRTHTILVEPHLIAALSDEHVGPLTR